MRVLCKSRGALVVVVVALVGCNADPYGTEYVTKRPSRSDFVGRWLLDDQSCKLLKELGYDVPGTELEFGARATFSMPEAPACWSSFGEEADFNSLSGTWKFERDARCWDIELNIDRINGKEAVSAADLFMRKRGTEYVLYAIVGDPDERDALRFQKVRDE